MRILGKAGQTMDKNLHVVVKDLASALVSYIEDAGSRSLEAVAPVVDEYASARLASECIEVAVLVFASIVLLIATLVVRRICRNVEAGDGDTWLAIFLTSIPTFLCACAALLQFKDVVYWYLSPRAMVAMELLRYVRSM